MNCSPETADVCRSGNALEQRLAASDFDLGTSIVTVAMTLVAESPLIPVPVVESDQISPRLISGWALGENTEEPPHWNAPTTDRAQRLSLRRSSQGT